MLMMYKILSEDMGQIKWCFQKKWGKDNENTECNILKRKRAPISFPTSVH